MPYCTTCANFYIGTAIGTTDKNTG